MGAARFDEIAEGAEPTPEEGEDLLACISGVTAGRFVAGALITQTSLESLTLDTLDCMAPRFAEAAPSDLFDGIASLSGGGPLGDPSGLFSVALEPLLEALFCLNDEERTAVDAEIAAAGGGDFSLTVGQMECVHESLGGRGSRGSARRKPDHSAQPLQRVGGLRGDAWRVERGPARAVAGGGGVLGFRLSRRPREHSGIGFARRGRSRGLALRQEEGGRQQQ